jgi:hypothetical protein
MSQALTISTSTPVELRPLIQSAIQRELGTLEIGIKRTLAQIHIHESVHKMSSSEFETRFNGTDLVETPEFTDWWMELLALKRLRAQRQTLSEATVD